MLFPALTVCTSFVDRGTMLPELQVQDVQPNINVEELVLGMHNGFSALVNLRNKFICPTN